MPRPAAPPYPPLTLSPGPSFPLSIPTLSPWPDPFPNRIRQEVDDQANIIFGSAFDESLQGRIRVSVVATGLP